MGEKSVASEVAAEQLRRFMKCLLNEVQAFEEMLDRGLIEAGIRRIGAEQELVLIDRHQRPATINVQLLEELEDPHFTTELGRFNLEFNLDPQPLTGSCLSHMEGELKRLLRKVREAASRHGAEVLLTGILPTLEKSDLTLANMTPVARYRELNDAMTRLRGGDYHFRIKGQDELIVRHDNVMLEACNTSFQVHFQVSPDEFARLYNVAQAVAAPVLAAAANSPLLFGRRLWRETRIALFQQSIDTRTPTADMREQLPRVRFGRRWVERSVLEIFQEDIARFRLLLAAEINEDPFAALAAGRAPALKALRLHNSTVYRWNRPCYGISETGKAHLRIENRVLPAGPTIVDEMANAAFWFGLMKGVSEEFGDITRVMEFDAAQENFISAARLGLGAQLRWPGLRRAVPAQRLIGKVLVPLAREGLAALGIDAADVERYLGIIAARVGKLRTGAQWTLDSLAALRDTGTKAERLAAITAASLSRQRQGRPVHEWKPARIEEAGGWARHYSRIEQFMTTDLFTVNEDELVDLVAAMMYWEHIRHVPVEDDDHHLVGLVTHRTLLRVLARGEGRERPLPVKDIMQREVVTVAPETPTLEAIAVMRQHKIGCLPVAKEGRLVGIVTERDFMNIARQLLEDELRK
jgi:CBS domain-containing protein